MIVRVEKHTAGYSVIDNTGLNDSRLSLKARGLLGYLLTKPDEWEVKVAGIISQVPDGRDAVQAGLKELERFGYAEYKVVRCEGGRLGGKRWVIHERSVKPLENQLGMSHRQTGFPIIGKTDYRKNRLSENPQQVSTINRVSTDSKKVLISNADAAKKNGVISIPSDSPPPVPAPPPQLFADSDWAKNGLDVWRSSMLALGLPEETNTNHYFTRCQRWSLKNSKLSSDWLQFAVSIARDDYSRGELKVIENANTTTKPGPNPSKPFDPKRTLDRASRILGRTG